MAWQAWAYSGGAGAWSGGSHAAGYVFNATFEKITPSETSHSRLRSPLHLAVQSHADGERNLSVSISMRVSILISFSLRADHPLTLDA